MVADSGGRWMQCVLPLRILLLFLLTVYSLRTKPTSHLPCTEPVSSYIKVTLCPVEPHVPIGQCCAHVQIFLVASYEASRGNLNIDSCDWSLDAAHDCRADFSFSSSSDMIDFIPGELYGQDLCLFFPAVSLE